jgi:hypothetical protein
MRYTTKFVVYLFHNNNIVALNSWVDRDYCFTLVARSIPVGLGHMLFSQC